MKDLLLGLLAVLVDPVVATVVAVLFVAYKLGYLDKVVAKIKAKLTGA